MRSYNSELCLQLFQAICVVNSVSIAPGLYSTQYLAIYHARAISEFQVACVYVQCNIRTHCILCSLFLVSSRYCSSRGYIIRSIWSVPEQTQMSQLTQSVCGAKKMCRTCNVVYSRMVVNFGFNILHVVSLIFLKVGHILFFLNSALRRFSLCALSYSRSRPKQWAVRLVSTVSG